MSFSQETTRQIQQFAKEQSQYYLEEAEMTYLERLRKKGGQARDKAAGKLARLRPSSDKRLEAQDDMVLYISDYMADLMSKGMGEEEALRAAKAELAFSSHSGQTADLQEKYRLYYEQQDPAVQEAIGLYYGASMLICIVAGGVGGALLGVTVLQAPLWIPVVAGVGAGVLLGAAFGMIKHASVIRGAK